MNRRRKGKWVHVRFYRKRTLQWLLVLALLAGAGKASWDFLYLPWRFDSEVAALREAGDPVTWADVAGEPIGGADNLWVGLNDASDRMFAIRTTWGKPPYVRMDSEKEGNWSREERAEVRAFLLSLDPFFAELSDALQRPGFWLPFVQWMEDVADDQTTTVHALLMDLAAHLSYRVAFDGRIEDYNARAADSILMKLELADRHRIPLGWGQELANELRRWTLADIQAATTHFGFRAPEFRRLVDRRLADLVPPRGPPRRPVKEERAAGLEMFRRLLDGEDVSLWGTDFKKIAWHERPTAYAEVHDYLQRIDRALRLCDGTPEFALDASRSWAVDESAVVTGLAAQLPRPTADYFRDYADTTAAVRLARVALALLVHRERNGSWPNRLGELHPLFPDGVPKNPLTGEPFGYARNARRILLYARLPVGHKPGAKPPYGEMGPHSWVFRR